MTEKEKEIIRNLSGIMKDENIDKGFDSISEIPNSSFDNKKNISFITDQSIDTNLRASLNTSTSKKKPNDIEKMLPLFIEKLSQNMQNVDFKLTLNKNPTTNNNPSSISDKPKTPVIESNPVTSPTNLNSGTAPTISLNNQKQKEAISMKYNNMQNNSLTINKHINNNFNVIDEIIEEDLISRASITVNNADLELCILGGQTADQKISDKLKNKSKATLEKVKQQSFMKSTNKSLANLNQSTKIKNYIKDKQKVSGDNPFSVTATSSEFNTQTLDATSNRNHRTTRVSPDTALNKKEVAKGDREAVSKDIKKDEKKRVASRTPPRFNNQERGVSRDLVHNPVTPSREVLPTHGNFNPRKPSVSPDVKRDGKRSKPIENYNTNNTKKEKKEKIDLRIEKIDKLIVDKENAKNKKVTINMGVNMNLKKAVKLKEKEHHKTEENTNTNKKVTNKIIEKQRSEIKNTMITKKDSSNKLKSVTTENNIDDIPSINCDTKEFFEIICIVSELFSNSPNEVKKVLKSIIDLNKSESDNNSNVLFDKKR